jgi:hypothetical protein
LPGCLGDPFGPMTGRCAARPETRAGEYRIVAYLVIMVLVAVLGITRLWLQQRREQSQMETIEGFSSALDAIKPEMPVARPRRSRIRRSEAPKGKKKTRSATPTRRALARRRRRAPKPLRSLVSWFVAAPEVERARRAEARRRIEARRVQREAAQMQARRDYRPPVPRRRDIAYETIDLTDDRSEAPRTSRPPRRDRVPVAAAQMSYSSRYRNHPR